MADEVDVEGVELTRRDDGVHDLMGAAVGAFLGDEADASEDAEDVRVEREDFRVAGEEERAGDGFGADAAKLREIVCCRFGRECVQKTEIECAARLFDLTKETFDDRRFLVGEAAGLDRRGDGRFACAERGVPIGKATLEGGEGAPAVGVARGLREDDLDEHVERVGAVRVLRHAVCAFEILDDVANRSLLSPGRRRRRR